MQMVDWSDGTYEHTAATLSEAARLGVAAAQITPGARVLDLGCGTGNAALEAARLGARVLAVDPASRLLDVARTRAEMEGLTIEVAVADASLIPADDASFDAVVSIFAVIFAPDATRAASEMLRVVRPGGRIVLTSWLPRGALAEAGMILREALLELQPAPAVPSCPPQWGNDAYVRALFEAARARVSIDEHEIVFEAPSAEAWFAEQEQHHPFWRFVRRSLADRPAAWGAIRERSIACLRSGSEEPDRLRLRSGYLLATIVR